MSEIISSRKWQRQDTGKSIEVAIIEDEIAIDLGEESISFPAESAKEFVFVLQQLIATLEGGN